MSRRQDSWPRAARAASGKVGVFMVTSGPGATNAVTPIADCNGDSVPVVLICGQVPRAAIGSDAFQEAPVFNIMSACAKRVFLPSGPGKLEHTSDGVRECARTGRPGPVVVDVPKDVQNWIGHFHGHGTLHFRGYSERLKRVAHGDKLEGQKRAQALRPAAAKPASPPALRGRVGDRRRGNGRATPILRAL